MCLFMSEWVYGSVKMTFSVTAHMAPLCDHSATFDRKLPPVHTEKWVSGGRVK